MVTLRNGHAPGHVRDTFLAAVEAFMAWRRGDSEPTVEFEERHIPISKACGLVWKCTDVIPGSEFRELCDRAGLKIGRQTYSACARAMLGAIKQAA